MVLTEYVEQGDYAEAALDLRLANGEYADLSPYLPDPVILRNAQYTLSHDVAATNAYSYSDRKGQDITLEVEAGRVSLYGRVAIATEGQQAVAALSATPGVVEVADRLLYMEDLKEQVEQALAAKGLDNIYVLSEHGLVNLRGEAPDSKTRYQAEDIAKRIPGVRAVVNDIVVTPGVAG
jgi:osmotically-inducible protein OsmY